MYIVETDRALKAELNNYESMSDDQALLGCSSGAGCGVIPPSSLIQLDYPSLQQECMYVCCAV